MNSRQEPADAIKGKVALVTGVNGFLGRHLISLLRSLQISRVIGIGRRPSGSMQSCPDAYFSIELGKFHESQKLIDCLGQERPDYIFHLAGGPDPSITAAVEKNISAAAQLLEAVGSRLPVARILFVGSAAEYGKPPECCRSVPETYACQPQSVYGVAKFTQTLLAQEAARAGLHVNIARLFNVVGPGVSTSLLPGAVIARALDAIESGASAIKVGNVAPIRDYLSVQDAVLGLLLVCLYEGRGEVFNVCSGSPTSVGVLIEEILSKFPGHIGYESDYTLAKAADVLRVVGDPGKLARATGFLGSGDITSSVAEMVDEAMRARAKT